MKLKPHSVLIPNQVTKNYKLRLKLTKSQKLNIIRYGLKYIHIKYIK